MHWRTDGHVLSQTISSILHAHRIHLRVLIKKNGSSKFYTKFYRVEWPRRRKPIMRNAKDFFIEASILHREDILSFENFISLKSSNLI